MPTLLKSVPPQKDLLSPGRPYRVPVPYDERYGGGEDGSEATILFPGLVLEELLRDSRKSFHAVRGNIIRPRDLRARRLLQDLKRPKCSQIFLFDPTWTIGGFR